MDAELQALIDKHMASNDEVLEAIETMIEVGATLPDPHSPLTLTYGAWHGLVLALAALQTRQNALIELAGNRRRELEARVAVLEARPAIRYVGVWSDGRDYAPGNLCTWSGSLWVCHSETTTKPGGPAWQLIVKGGQR